MNKERVLVYDSSKGFSRFIKINFYEDFEIVCCTNSKKINELDLKNFKFAFFIINNFEDIIDFILIFSFIKRIYLGTNNSEINDKLKDNENIILLDLGKKKIDLIKEIKQNIQIYKLLDH